MGALEWLSTFPLPLLIVIVAAMWGVTNPFINRSTKSHNIETKNGIQFLYSLLFNIPFILAYGINQAASAVYMAVLAVGTLSIVQPITNALTLIITMITSYLLGEQRFTYITCMGILLVLFGTYICLTSQ